MNIYSEHVNANEVVVFCDEHGVPTGEVGPKLDSHTANTKLHLAFSLYVFSPSGKILVTQRAATKKVWPGVWTNSCCGHIAPGETAIDAAIRRLKFELGMSADRFQVVIPDYVYKTPPFNGIIDHEFCPVIVAVSDQDPAPHPEEVHNFTWVDWQWLLSQAEQDGDDYSNPTLPAAPAWSWWCKDQLHLLSENKEFAVFLQSLHTTGT